MALKITKSIEPIEVKNITTCIYSAPGLGKTTLAFTAEAPLLLDFDRGAHRARNRKDIVQVHSWADVEGITPSDLKPYKTLVLDTAGRALDFLTSDILSDAKNRMKTGALTMQGYGVLKRTFIEWFKRVNTAGIDVILIAHCDEQRNGDEIIERLDIQGGSKNEIYKSSDVMGRIYIENGQRVLNFSPTDVSFGKNPGELDPIKIPNQGAPEFGNFLAGIIEQIKGNINRLSADAKAELERFELVKAGLSQLVEVDEFNEAVTRLTDAPAVDKSLLIRLANDRGYVFNQKTKSFAVLNVASNG